VYVGGVGLGTLLVLLALLSGLYVFSYERLRQIELDAERLRQERNALREQALSANQEAFEAKERAFLARAREQGSAPQEQTADYTLAFGEEVYQPPILVTAYSTRVTPGVVEVSFRLENQGDSANNRGGFLFAIFENDERTPVSYVATPSVGINAEGFPESYKLGIRFTRIREAVTFRRQVRRPSGEEVYTHVTLYLFTVRGGLLLRERFELERELFFKDHPVVRTQQLSTL
jgi:hypothetical protein